MVCKPFSILLLLVVCVLQVTCAFAQTQLLDSLRLKMTTAADIKSRITATNDYAVEMQSSKHDSSRQYARKALRLSQSIGYHTGMGVACNTIGFYYYGKNNDSSLYYFKQAVAHYTQVNETIVRIARAYNNMLNAYIEMARYDSAIQIGKKALAYIASRPETGKDKEERLMYLNGTMGRTYYFTSEYDSSATYYLKAAATAEKLQNDEMLASYYLGMAMVHGAAKEFDRAIWWGKRTVAVCEKAKDSGYMVLAYASVGGFYERVDSLAEAKKYVDHSISVACRYDSSLLEDDSYLVLGNIEARLKNYKQAMASYQKGLLMKSHAGGSVFSRCVYYRKFADLYLLMDSLPQAEKAYLIAQQMCASDRQITAEGMVALSEVQKRMGNYKAAYDNLQKGTQLLDSIFNANKSKVIQDLSIKYETENKEKKLLLLEQEKTMQEASYNRQKNRLILLIIGALATGTILAMYYNRQKIRSRAASQQAILKERLRISRELHDEVGATLSGIVMYSHLTKQQAQSGQVQAVDRSLGVMQQSSEEMVGKLNEIVWLVNPEKDTLQKLIQRLEEYARNMAVIKSMKVDFRSPDVLPETGLSFDHRRNIYLVCKEAINNAIKYSDGQLLSVHFSLQSTRLAITIRDDGKGFDTQQSQNGNGLANMRKRAEEIGAVFTMQAVRDKGTTIHLECPIA